MLIPKSLTDELTKATSETQRDRSPSTKFFIDASGDWREVLHDGSWWVVGHHLVYPARDRDDAQRLRTKQPRARALLKLFRFIAQGMVRPFSDDRSIPALAQSIEQKT